MKGQIINLFAGGVLALALFGAAMAGPLEDAQEADHKKPIRKATTRRNCRFCVHWPSKGTPSRSSASA
jgi:hypothetical protein